MGEISYQIVQAYPIFGVAFLVIVVELVVKVLKRGFLDDIASEEEVKLAQEVNKLKIEAQRNNFPATFMTWAKLSRQANKLEAELESKRVAREASLHVPWKKTLRSALTFRLFFLLAAISLLPKEEGPLLEVPYQWVWPLSRPLSNGSLSKLVWAVVCQRVVVQLV
mmetsp:Transcript_9352/g.10779  ORF Transcript_9352/g.10779 Transcript_9352/m.10779 type:complete len:166 (-) Transcript_9352:63-560(-)